MSRNNTRLTSTESDKFVRIVFYSIFHIFRSQHIKLSTNAMHGGAFKIYKEEEQ